MSATRGRLEAQIYQASNWAPTATGTASAAATVSANATRYPTTLLTAFATALSTATGDTVTVTGSFGETGTGLVTISSTANLAINWGAATDLRDLLGFAGNLSAATSHVGTKVMQGVWLPNAVMAAPRHVDNGATQIDRSILVAPGGTVYAYGYQRRQKLGRVTWSHVQHRYALEAGEVTDRESFECWYLDTHGGRVSYFTIAPAVNLYWDAGAGTAVTIRLTEPIDGYNPERVVPEWIGYFPVVIDGYVVT